MVGPIVTDGFDARGIEEARVVPLPPAPRPPWRHATASEWLRLALAMGLLVYGPLIALMVADGRLPSHAFSGWLDHLTPTVPTAILVAATSWPVAWLLTRRSQMVALTAMFAVMFTPLVAWRLVAYLDVARDTDPGRSVTVRYVRHVRHAKDNGYDVVTGWDDPTHTINLQGLEVAHNDVRPGDEVRLRVHRGWLGVEWVEADARR